jgi:5-methylcytosine-specific restriction protein A
MISIKEYKEFLRSKPWRNLRKLVLVNNKYLCQNCLKKGIIRKATICHHILPARENWNKRLDYDNILPVCDECHRELENNESGIAQFLKKWEFETNDYQRNDLP